MDTFVDVEENFEWREQAEVVQEVLREYTEAPSVDPLEDWVDTVRNDRRIRES